MELHQKIKKKQQYLLKLERNLALKKLKERKADTRKKIEFGGLVIKSNMNKFPKAVILGALIDAFETLQHNQAAENIFKLKGESSFMGYQDQE